MSVLLAYAFSALLMLVCWQGYADGQGMSIDLYEGMQVRPVRFAHGVHV